MSHFCSNLEVVHCFELALVLRARVKIFDTRLSLAAGIQATGFVDFPPHVIACPVRSVSNVDQCPAFLRAAMWRCNVAAKSLLAMWLAMSLAMLLAMSLAIWRVVAAAVVKRGVRMTICTRCCRWWQSCDFL